MKLLKIGVFLLAMVLLYGRLFSVGGKHAQ